MGFFLALDTIQASWDGNISNTNILTSAKKNREGAKMPETKETAVSGN